MSADDLYAHHHQGLFKLARFLVQDDATAEQIVQDSSADLRGAARRLPDDAAALAYLRQSVVNRSRSMLRHRMVMDKHTPKPPPELPRAALDVIALLERPGAALAIRSLPERQRQALELHHQGLSVAQVASAMGISRGAVRSHTARGMSALRAAVNQDTPPPDPGQEDDS